MYEILIMNTFWSISNKTTPERCQNVITWDITTQGIFKIWIFWVNDTWLVVKKCETSRPSGGSPRPPRPKCRNNENVKRNIRKKNGQKGPNEWIWRMFKIG